MSRGKQIKSLPSPDLKQPLTLELIGQSIKARRTQQKLDMKTTAMLCGISAVTLGKIENASRGVRMESVLKVMASLGMKLEIQPWDSAHD